MNRDFLIIMKNNLFFVYNYDVMYYTGGVIVCQCVCVHVYYYFLGGLHTSSVFHIQ